MLLATKPPPLSFSSSSFIQYAERENEGEERERKKEREGERRKGRGREEGEGREDQKIRKGAHTERRKPQRILRERMD